VFKKFSYSVVLPLGIQFKKWVLKGTVHVHPNSAIISSTSFFCGIQQKIFWRSLSSVHTMKKKLQKFRISSFVYYRR